MRIVRIVRIARGAGWGLAGGWRFGNRMGFSEVGILLWEVQVCSIWIELVSQRNVFGGL